MFDGEPRQALKRVNCRPRHLPLPVLEVEERQYLNMPKDHWQNHCTVNPDYGVPAGSVYAMSSCQRAATVSARRNGKKQSEQDKHVMCGSQSSAGQAGLGERG